jgi:hypothetical protein
LNDKRREEYLNRAATMRAKHRLSIIHNDEFLSIYNDEYNKLAIKYDRMTELLQEVSHGKQ